MKALLARFTPYKGIGLYIGEHEVVVCHVASTPLGLVELARQSENYAPDQLADVVARLLEPLIPSGKRASPIALGISARRVFFTTRPLRADSTGTSPQTLLREVLQSPNICIDEMTIEVSNGEFGKRKLASVASCRKEYILGLLQTLQGCGVHPFRTEPAPFALLRAGIQRRRGRRSKIVLRLFLGDGEALAIVTAGGLCIFWKSFKLPSGGEIATLGAAVRSCQTLTAHCGIDAPPDAVIVHGRADLRAELTGEEFGQNAGAPVVWCEGPELNGAAVAFGLALGCLGQQPSDLPDLSHSMTPSPSLWQIFPWGEVAVQVALVVCMALFMLVRSHSAETAIVPVQVEVAKHSWAHSKQQPELTKEKQNLAQRVEAIRKFAATRIIWTRYTHDISSRLPTNVTLMAFQGVCELEDPKAKGRPKKSFTIRAAVPLPEDGSTPKEIDQFLTALRGHPLLQRDFPVADLADIKCTKNDKRSLPHALFTVVCLPKANGPPATAALQGAAQGGHK